MCSWINRSGEFRDHTRFNYRTGRNITRPGVCRQRENRWRWNYLSGRPSNSSRTTGRDAWSTYNFVIIRLCTFARFQSSGAEPCRNHISARSAGWVYLKWVRWIGYCPARCVNPAGANEKFVSAGAVYSPGRNEIPTIAARTSVCVPRLGTKGARGRGRKRGDGARSAVRSSDGY